MDIFDALKTEGTTAVSDIAAETKKADVLSLPFWISAIFGGGFYAARNGDTVSAVARHWHIIKG